MILRRLKEALARQDWFAVGLELIIVIVGVLIALAANNWSQSQSEMAIEIDSLQELRRALQVDVISTEEDIRIHQQAGLSARLLLDHFKDKYPYSDTLGIHFGNLRAITVWVRDETAYETLQLRGMETVTSDTLRSAIGELYGSKWQAALKIQDALRGFTLQRVYPFFIANFEDLESPVDYETLLRSTQFRYLLASLADYHPSVATLLKDSAGDIYELIDMIDYELLELEGN